MKEKKMHPLKNLLVAALSLHNGMNAAQWEGHLAKAFNESLGGEDVFTSDVVRSAGGYILATIADRYEVSFNIYACESVTLTSDDQISRRYAVAGKGLFCKCIFGDLEEVRLAIERTYREADEALGYTAFAAMYGKQSPYVAADDRGLIDISAGVVDCIKGYGSSADSPLVLHVPASSRFHARQYQDIRRFVDCEVLVEGLYGAWRALVSSEKQDWKLFSGMVRSVFL